MALKEYQTTLSAGRLYEVSLKAAPNGSGDELNPSIWANAAVSVYGSNSATIPTALSVMTLEESNTDVAGHLVFARALSVIPRYIAIAGSATEIIASGLNVIDLGAIS